MNPLSQLGQVSAGAKTDFDRLLHKELAKTTRARDEHASGAAQAAAALLARRQKLSPVQLKMVESPSKRKVGSCTRRAGKTYGAVQLALEAIMNTPWTDTNRSQPVVQIIATTAKDAKRLFWEPLKAAASSVGMVGVWNDHECVADFPNGATLRLGGASDMDAINGYRGASYSLVILDEAASFGPKMETIIMEAISMALTDYDGTILMIGTPGKVRVGFFYEVVHGMHAAQGWELFTWSYWENPGLPDDTKTLEWIVKTQGPLDSPKVRRECFGEWVADGSSLVYKFIPETGYFDGKLPEGHEWRFILGLDLGYRDPTAFSVVAHSKTTPLMYVVHVESHKHMLPTQIAEKVLELRAKYAFKRIVCDTGGSMARNSMEEWNKRYGFGMTAATKQNKAEFIEHMNSDFYQGRLKVYPNCPVVKDWEQLIWTDDEKSVRQNGAPVEDKRYHNHMADATLYAFRESMHFRGKVPEPGPELGTQAYLNKRETDARLKYLRTAKTRASSYNKLWK